MSKYSKKGFSKDKRQERKKKINNLTKDMDKAIDNYFETPEQLKEYLSFMTNFYQYSPRNTALIHSQFSGAKAVGSFKFWKEMGFHINKGEKGIQMLVPNKTQPKFKDEDGKWKNISYANSKQKELIKSGRLEEQRSKIYFRIGHVFDISQTNAKASDLPEIFPNRWMEGEVENYETFMGSLSTIAEGLNATVGDPLGELGSAKGAFYHAVDKKGTIGHIGLNPRNSELQNLKTMIHELAHAKLHSRDKAFGLSSEEKEFQAEMVAYTTASYFGIDTSEYSLGYLANWTKGKELIDKEKLLGEVREASIEFIEVVEKDLLIRKENEVDAKSTNNNLNWYEMKNRPVSPGCQPDGFIEVDHDKGNWGVVAYDRKLTERELNDYEMAVYKERELTEQKSKEDAIDKEFEDKDAKKYIILEYGSFGAVDIKEVSGQEIIEFIQADDTLYDIEEFNKMYKEEFTLIDPFLIKEPTIVVKWSESNELPSNKFIPYVEANEITTELAENNVMGYDKTWYSVLIPNGEGNIDVIPMDRLDIGDGQYMNIHHQVRKEVKTHLSERKWMLLDDVIMDRLLKDENKEIKTISKKTNVRCKVN